MNKDSITTHDQIASEYDRLVQDYGSHAAEILFGLCFEYTQPGERLLDLGIGTGLSSQNFAKAGLEVYGLDGSAAMLAACEAKGFARELKEWDLQQVPWPYEDSRFNHVLACGLFHFFSDLEPSFAEAARLLEPAGVFAFTVMSRSGVDGIEAAQGSFSEIRRGEVTGAVHSGGYIKTLLESNQLHLLKRVRFLQWSGQGRLDDEFTAYIARKAGVSSL